VQYYDAVMPGLINLIIGTANNTHEHARELRGLAFETAGHIGVAVGGELFKNDGIKLMQLFAANHRMCCPT